jgi:uncharacterized membrane protein
MLVVLTTVTAIAGYLPATACIANRSVHCTAGQLIPIIIIPIGIWVECLQKLLMESHARSIAKAVSYRIVGSAVTALIFFALTGKGTLSVGAGALDVVLKIGAYFVHEGLWDHIVSAGPSPRNTRSEGPSTSLPWLPQPCWA